MGVTDVSLGHSFGIIKDHAHTYNQIGSLFLETNNVSNLQILDNVDLKTFTCGHDFVVGLTD